MIFAALILAVASQAAFMDPPAPPPLAPPGSAIFEQQKAAYENELRAACISKQGAAILVADFAKRRAEVVSNSANPEWRQHERAIADAAYASPIDMKKLEAAIQARAQYQARSELTSAQSKIAVLRTLSASDREIYARKLPLMLPTQPPRVCAVPRS